MAIKVFLYGQEDQTSIMSQMLSDYEDISIVGKSDDENNVLEQVRSLKADVMLMYADGSASGYRVALQLYMLCPSCINFAIVSSDVFEQESIKLLRNGVQYAYDDTIGEDELISNIKSAVSIEGNRKSVLESGKGNMSDGKIFSFYCPKSGLGRSTFVINTAVSLARDGFKVAVIDMDLQFGDINVLTQIEPKETIAELLQEQTSLSMDNIRPYINFYQSGVNLLCAPKNLEYADKLRTEQVEKLLSVLRPYYDYILVDCASTLDTMVFTCCEQSSRVFVFVRSDISSVRHCKRAISMLESMGHAEKIDLILFNDIKKSDIDKKSIERATGHDIWHTVPWDQKTAVESLNQGEPVMIAFPKSALAKACASAADKLSSSESDEGTKKFAFSLGRKKQ